MSHTAPHTARNAKSVPAANVSGISLEQVELEMVLNLKTLGKNDFTSVLHEAAEESNAEVLFDLPPERFPFECCAVACVKLNTPGDATYCYVYCEENSKAFSIASIDDLGSKFLGFAQSYVGVMEQLRSIVGSLNTNSDPH